MRCLFFVALALFGCALALAVDEPVEYYESFALEKEVNKTLECIRGVLIKGLPNKGLPPLNPLDAKELNINFDNLGLGKFISGKLNGKNVKVNGITTWFTKSLKGKLSVIPPSYELDGEFTIAKIDGKGDYDGKIKLINKHDLFGKGKIDADVQKIDLKLNAKIKINNKKYQIEKLSLKLSLGKVKATITGLNNDAALSAKVSKWLTESLVPELNKNPNLVDENITPHLKDALNEYLNGGAKPGGIIEEILKLCPLPI